MPQHSGLWRLVRLGLGYFYDFAVALGGPGLFFIALADSSFLSLPEGNDILIVILSAGQTWGKMAYYVSMTTLGSIAGCMILYGLGRRGGPFTRRRLKNRLQTISGLYRKWGLWMVLVPSILPPPTPFKVFVLSAGLLEVPLIRFLLAITLGRSIRYLTWGVLAIVYGELTHRFLDQNILLIGTLLLIVFLVALGLYFLIQVKSNKEPHQQELA